ncbi:hypothetical protein WOLCODRAFT_61552 [Wolfiporia cocos MD-104 SS10]|uniref:UBC core domain-containing protein n=1 Tax=Wolfiporia cocos (strain MD-104) TaxID=742152 RepID=A0A2H3IW95_WOLCO|nr:hypothetical protein WOLCODRAFT_61552 [Wolfiporia cocos MD-104 SS10]
MSSQQHNDRRAGGPEGTQYAGGSSEFDCFIPFEFPHKPPLMHLRTTGNDPDLYNNGMICWGYGLGGAPEERWSSKSTLLQVEVQHPELDPR